MLPSQLILKKKRKRLHAESNYDHDEMHVRSSRLYQEPSARGTQLQSTHVNWKQSQLPDYPMGSMDGFLGLEELDGVDAQDLTHNRQARAITGNICSRRSKSPASDVMKFHQFEEELPSSTMNVAHKSRSISDLDTKYNPTSPISNISNRSFTNLPQDEQPYLPAWQNLNLSENISRGLFKLNFLTPTRIQGLAIPGILDGHDVIGKASTGSGKTLAFGLPIIQHCLSSKTDERFTSALILAPTRELAQQLCQHLVAVAQFTGTSIVLITGGLAVEKQIRLFRRTPDIVVATPGRLWDLISSQEGFLAHLQHVRFLVLDEADRLLQHGHFTEVTKIVDALGTNSDRQTLVFSATFDDDLQHKLANGKATQYAQASPTENSLQRLLEKLKLRDGAKIFDANPGSRVVQAVKQCLIETSPMDKDFYLYYLLLRHPARTLVFTNSISDVHRLVHLLNLLGIAALGLHSNKQQKARLKSIERFKSNENAVLIASDIAARGLDIPSVDTVIHYHLPRTADLYIHRSGRTARANAGGLSILISSSNERQALRKLQNALYPITIDDFPVSAEQVGVVKPRVNIGRQVQKLEDQASRKNGSRDAWLAEAAEDLGVELDTEGQSKSSTDDKLVIKALRKKLSHMLQQPFSEGLSGRYLTKGGATMAQRLLSGRTHTAFVGEQIQKLSERFDSKHS